MVGMGLAYYNENSPSAVAWLRELIKQGHIADGVVMPMPTFQQPRPRPWDC